MEGWKTKVGAVLLILTGMAGFAAQLLGYEGLSMETALAMIGAGFAAAGLGHKFDKVKGVLEGLKK